MPKQSVLWKGELFTRKEVEALYKELNSEPRLIAVNGSEAFTSEARGTYWVPLDRATVLGQLAGFENYIPGLAIRPNGTIAFYGNVLSSREVVNNQIGIGHQVYGGRVQFVLGAVSCNK